MEFNGLTTVNENMRRNIGQSSHALVSLAVMGRKYYTPLKLKRASRMLGTLIFYFD